MKEVKILIRFVDDKFGFAIDRSKEDKEIQTEVAKLLMALEAIKQKELSRIGTISSFGVKYRRDGI